MKKHWRISISPFIALHQHTPTNAGDSYYTHFTAVDPEYQVSFIKINKIADAILIWQQKASLIFFGPFQHIQTNISVTCGCIVYASSFSTCTIAFLCTISYLANYFSLGAFHAVLFSSPLHNMIMNTYFDFSSLFTHIFHHYYPTSITKRKHLSRNSFNISRFSPLSILVGITLELYVLIFYVFVLFLADIYN